MLWITTKDANGYPQLIDLHQYPQIFINTVKDQPKSDMSRTVWGRYDSGAPATPIYKGTEVECIRIIEQLKGKLDAIELQPWENQPIKETPH